MEIDTVGVVGAGTMGSAIAEVMAFNGRNVVLKDISAELLERGRKNIERILRHLVEYHEKRAPEEIRRIEALGVTLTDEQKRAIAASMKPKYDSSFAEGVMGRIKFTMSYEDMSGCQLVIEAAFERPEIKKEIFAQLDRCLGEEAYRCTNTSSISITSLASSTRSPGLFLGTHFFNPPYTLPLVEVIPGLQTDEATVAHIMEFLRGLRNHRREMLPIRVKDSPGFVVNRMIVPAQNEACFILQEGLASAREIDDAMKAGAGWPMGPLELADMVGLDIAYDVSVMLYREFGDPKYRPPTLLKRMVEAGYLGRKSGRGFYEYR